MREEQDLFDRRAIRRAFSRASVGYDAAAVLQSEVRDTLLQRLELARLQPSVVLDAGAGTAQASRRLKARYPKARVIALDSAPGMLLEARRQQRWWRRFERVCADAAQLPLADASVDLIFSNLMLPWNHPDAVLEEFRRVLRPGGLLSLSSCGPDTLRELRSAWSAVDGGAHVHPFIDMHDLGDALVRAGFNAPVLDVERYTLNYVDVGALLKDLRANGARNSLTQRRRGLTGGAQLSAMQRAYEPYRVDGRIIATAEIVFANAWAPQNAPRRGEPQEASVSLAEITAELRARTRGS
jgi:malonyl-CoA O-methyltransferase